LSTFDTVATETPAAPAISASVVLPFGTVASGPKVSATRNYHNSPVTVVCTPEPVQAQLLTQSQTVPILISAFRLFRNFSKLDHTAYNVYMEGLAVVTGPWRSMSAASISARVDMPTPTPLPGFL
jgi:hypothetical protein